MSQPVTRFNRAIVRRPAASVIDGLRAIDVGAPDFAAVIGEHDAYCAALNDAGVTVDVLEALPEFTDSVFVEDPAMVFTEGAILLKPGAASREGETKMIADDIRSRFDRVLNLGDGHAEGGDVLVTPDAVLIGLSARTDEAGAQSLIDCLAKLGKKGQIFQTPEGVLHFKTDCSLVDEDTVLATSRLAGSDAFKSMRVLQTPDGEEAAANALRVNDVVFVGSDFPRTIDMLTDAGYDVIPLPTTEIGKVDAGLSCMSLRWWAD